MPLLTPPPRTHTHPNGTPRQVVEVFKFAVGSTVMVTKGRSTGRVGVLTKVEKHDGSFDIVEVKDTTGAVFATRLPNVFVIGRTADATACAIKLPKGNGIKRDIFEQRDSSRRKA